MASNDAEPNSPSTAALTGVGTSALAYITDYYVVPRRFTPGDQDTGIEDSSMNPGQASDYKPSAAASSNPKKPHLR